MQTRNDNRPPGWSRLALLAGIGLAAMGAVGLTTVPAEAAKTCKSQAYEKKDAEAYCRPIPKCEEKSPPEELNSTGNSTARRAGHGRWPFARSGTLSGAERAQSDARPLRRAENERAAAAALAVLVHERIGYDIIFT